MATPPLPDDSGELAGPAHDLPRADGNAVLARLDDPTLPLQDALQLVRPYFERAARRWLVRCLSEGVAESAGRGERYRVPRDGRAAACNSLAHSSAAESPGLGGETSSGAPAYRRSSPSTTS